MRLRITPSGLTILCAFVAILTVTSTGALRAPASLSAPGGATTDIAPAAWAAEPPLPAIVAPASIRQGDPLIAWLVCAQPRATPVATLFGPDGTAALSATGFDASPLISATPDEIDATAGAAAPPLSGAFVYGFIFGLPTTIRPGAYSIAACGADAKIALVARAFLSETIPLDRKNTDLRVQPDPRKELEAKKLYEILGRTNPSMLYAGPESFVLPLADQARRSSFFADKRVYAYSDGSTATSLHAGVDFAVAEGTPVLACAAGKVALAADRVVTGKTIVIEHLPGLYSLYMHLSALDVAEGDVVGRGSRIGLSGSTGLSTGPHLHWELRAHAAMVDPDLLTLAPVLDKALIINTIRALIEGR